MKKLTPDIKLTTLLNVRATTGPRTPRHEAAEVTKVLPPIHTHTS